MAQPCKSTFEICRYIDSFLKVSEGQQQFNFDVVLNSVMRKLSFETLFPASSFHDHDGEDDHQYKCIKSIAETFMNLESV